MLGFMIHLGHEWVILTNLLCLLMGFAILFRAKVHIGFLAAIVSASTAGGAWSVLGGHHNHNDVVSHSKLPSPISRHDSIAGSRSRDYDLKSIKKRRL